MRKSPIGFLHGLVSSAKQTARQAKARKRWKKYQESRKTEKSEKLVQKPAPPIKEVVSRGKKKLLDTAKKKTEKVRVKKKAAEDKKKAAHDKKMKGWVKENVKKVTEGHKKNFNANSAAAKAWEKKRVKARNKKMKADMQGIYGKNSLSGKAKGYKEYYKWKLGEDAFVAKSKVRKLAKKIKPVKKKSTDPVVKELMRRTNNTMARTATLGYAGKHNNKNTTD